MKHGQIATEHVLLGMLKVEESIAARALRELGATYRKARRRVLTLVDVGAVPVDGRLAYTPRVRKVIEDAFTGAVWSQKLGESLIGPSFARSNHPADATGPRVPDRLRQVGAEVRTEHLLLALIACGDGIAARVLADLGVDIEKAAAAAARIRFPDEAAPAWPVAGGAWPPAAPTTG